MLRIRTLIMFMCFLFGGYMLSVVSAQQPTCTTRTDNTPALQKPHICCGACAAKRNILSKASIFCKDKTYSLLSKSHQKKTDEKFKYRLTLKRMRKVCSENFINLEAFTPKAMWLKILMPLEHADRPAPDYHTIFPESLTIGRHKDICVIAPRA